MSLNQEANQALGLLPPHSNLVAPHQNGFIGIGSVVIYENNAVVQHLKL